MRELTYSLTYLFTAASVCSQSAATAEPPILEQIVAAASKREQQDYPLACVEWSVDEHITPEALKIGVAAKLKSARIPNDGCNMTYAQTVVFQGNKYRFEIVGQQLYSPLGSKEAGVHRIERVDVENEKRKDGFLRAIDLDKIGRGQFWQSSRPSPRFNDAAQQPIFLFARPSKVGLFRDIAAGNFVELIDEQADHMGWICLVDKKSVDTTGPATKVWLDKRHDFVPVHILQSNRREVTIVYRNFDGFGWAPSAWTFKQSATDGHSIRVWNARVGQWHRDPKKIGELIDYKYPAGTEVVDLDTRQPYVVADDGSLKPKDDLVDK
jgi:hypothetical protein